MPELRFYVAVLDLTRAVQGVRLALSKGHKVGDSPLTCGREQFQLPKRCSLHFRIPDDGQSPKIQYFGKQMDPDLLVTPSNVWIIGCGCGGVGVEVPSPEIAEQFTDVSSLSMGSGTTGRRVLLS
jgi:hypothetical protein